MMMMDTKKTGNDAKIPLEVVKDGNNDVDNKNNDCYFYYYSTCKRGDSCSFRHSSNALGSEVVCSFWRQGRCDKGSSCKYRHMEIDSKNNRSKKLCYWETQEGGCRKPHCVFKHRIQPKISLSDALTASDSSSKDATTVILPVSNISVTPSSLQTESEVNSSVTSPSTDITCLSEEATEAVQSPSIPIEPISFNVNHDDDVDSDEESKRQSSPVKKHDFQVKSLEQIRMEKVFQQNEMSEVTVREEPSHFPVKRRSLETNNEPTPAKKVKLVRPKFEVVNSFGLREEQPSSNDTVLHPVAQEQVETKSSVTDLSDILGNEDPLEESSLTSEGREEDDILEEIDQIING